jgi:hypothetical protein
LDTRLSAKISLRAPVLVTKKIVKLSGPGNVISRCRLDFESLKIGSFNFTFAFPRGKPYRRRV